MAAPFTGCFELFFHVAVLQCDFRSTARGFFRACGIEVTDKDDDEDYDKLFRGDELDKWR